MGCSGQIMHRAGWTLLVIVSASFAIAQAEEEAEHIPCDEALLYETADAHPDIRWTSMNPSVGNKGLSCLFSSARDDATIEFQSYFSSGLYQFARECETVGFDIYRLFEYKNKSRPYLLRLHRDPFVDPKTFVVTVSLFREESGTYHHLIGLKRCGPDS
ncbi:MAG: hypothetical protein O3A63_05495 [Proteobacteria bacterium]|nr:hypothetical protein [Pseudomonadota bacterium]